MSTITVVGAGGIGRAVADHLRSAGHEVRLVSRSGTDPQQEGVRAVAADVTDVDRLTDVVRGSVAVVNAVNPPAYHRWPELWPPMARAFLAVAERTGAGLVTVGNLYGYGRVAAPMTEETPLRPAGTKGEVRAAMWREALEAHEAGRVRATELRASDYFGAGAGAGTSLLNQYVIRPAAQGRRTVRLVVGVPDAPHTWTYLPDIGALAAALATSEAAWGRVWHVPSAPPQTFRQVAEEAARLAGHRAPRVVPMPRPAMLMARLSPTVRELDETAHQFQRPFVLDASRACEELGIGATPWEEALAETVRALG